MLDSPFISKLYKTYSDEHFIYFLMNAIMGADLFDVLREIGILNKKKAQFYIACMIVALEHLHDKNIIYRDLKPENILFEHESNEGEIKLIDFGLSRKYHAQEKMQTVIQEIICFLNKE